MTTRRTGAGLSMPALLSVLLALTSAAVLGVPAASSAASPAAYYVDRTVACSETGPGGTAMPFCTITKGMSAVKAGDTLYIGDGSYAETVKPLVSGSPNNPVTVTRWPGRSPTIGTGATYGAYLSHRSYVVISGLTFTGTSIDGIYVSGSDHILVTGNTVTLTGQPRRGATAPGISLRSSTASTVSWNTSDYNSSHGVYVSGTSTGNTIEGNEASFNAEGWRRNANGINVIAPANTILRNVVHDNEDSGLNFYTGGNDNLATLNVTYNNGDHGIDDYNVTGGRLIGNTVYHNCTSGINVEGTSGNYVVENNIAVDNAVYPAYNGISCSRRAGNIGIWDSAPATTTVDHNLVHLTKTGTMYVFKSSYTSLAAMQAATGQEASGVQGDPKFAGAASRDFRLTAGSPAIDRGDSGVFGAQSQDLLGNPRVDDPATANTFASGPRTYDDLGAYELQTGSSAPTARLTVTPTTGTAPLAVTADASTSTDPQGQTLTYKFDFGDSTSTNTQNAATTTHTYTNPGSYLLRVTTTDTSGLSDTTTQTVTVNAPTASAPTARLTVTPTTGTAPLAVTADASTSTDPQGQTLTYKFDFGDSTSTNTQNAATTTHTYTNPGSYLLRVTTTDTSGLSDTTTQTVTVNAPTASAPTARLTVTPTTGTAPLAVTADASTSTDPQGQTLTYKFDFGDSTSTNTQNAATTTHTYTNPGSYLLRVTTTDTSGLSDTTTQTVTVNAPTASAPTARLTVTPTTGTAPLAVTADASTSTDPQGQTLTYKFDFGDSTSTNTQNAATTTHTYTNPGSYLLRVTTTDTSGLSDTTTQTVTVTSATTTPPSFVNSIANNYSTSTKTSGYITVWRSAGVAAGDLVVLTLQLSGTTPTGAVSGTDAAGNTYTQSASVADGSGNRLVVLSGVATRALAVNDRITATFPSATAYRFGGDEFAGATRLDQSVTATGTGATFSSGTAQATSGNEIAFGAVSVPTGTAAPTWATGWRSLGTAAVGSRYLARAYQLPASGGYTATGTSNGAWLSTVSTFGP